MFLDHREMASVGGVLCIPAVPSPLSSPKLCALGGPLPAVGPLLGNLRSVVKEEAAGDPLIPVGESVQL